jgi:hypothetical protein
VNSRAIATDRSYKESCGSKKFKWTKAWEKSLNRNLCHSWKSVLIKLPDFNRINFQLDTSKTLFKIHYVSSSGCKQRILKIRHLDQILLIDESIIPGHHGCSKVCSKTSNVILVIYLLLPKQKLFLHKPVLIPSNYLNENWWSIIGHFLSLTCIKFKLSVAVQKNLPPCFCESISALSFREYIRLVDHWSWGEYTKWAILNVLHT